MLLAVKALAFYGLSALNLG